MGGGLLLFKVISFGARGTIGGGGGVAAGEERADGRGRGGWW